MRVPHQTDECSQTMTNAKIYCRTNYEEKRKIKRRKNDLLYRRSLAYECSRFVSLPVTWNVSKQPGFYTFQKGAVSIFQKGAMKGGSTFEIGAARLRSVTKIAPKSPFFCVNRTCMRWEHKKKKQKQNPDKLRGTLESKQENIQ